MKRVLIAASLGGLLLVGTPTLASSAQRNDSKAERTADNKGGDKGHRSDRSGDKGHRGGDNKSDRAHRGDRDRRDHRGDHGRHGRHRHGGHYRDGWYGGGYWYGEPQDCWYGPSGAYNCEPYGGDYYGGGYHPGWSGYGTQNRNVYVERHAFNPGEVHTGVGQEVLWIFRDSDPHTVTADNKSFDSGEIRQGEFRLVFEQPGTYSYHCALHPDMKGRVVVHG
jgi:plastocyanin